MTWVKSVGVLVIFCAALLGCAGLLLWAIEHAPWAVVAAVGIGYIALTRCTVFEGD